MKQVKEEFLKRKKDKAFCRFLRKWFGGTPLSDIEVAKNLSSMLTHSLIDMEGIGTPMYRALDITFQSESVAKFLGGGISSDELRKQYYSRFGTYLRGNQDGADKRVLGQDNQEG